MDYWYDSFIDECTCICFGEPSFMNGNLFINISYLIYQYMYFFILSPCPQLPCPQTPHKIFLIPTYILQRFLKKKYINYTT